MLRTNLKFFASIALAGGLAMMAAPSSANMESIPNIAVIGAIDYLGSPTDLNLMSFTDQLGGAPRRERR